MKPGDMSQTRMYGPLPHVDFDTLKDDCGIFLIWTQSPHLFRSSWQSGTKERFGIDPVSIESIGNDEKGCILIPAAPFVRVRVPMSGQQDESSYSNNISSSVCSRSLCSWNSVSGLLLLFDWRRSSAKPQTILWKIKSVRHAFCTSIL